MAKDILKLQPEALWKNFYSLTQIPRPSKKEEQVRAFLKKFGEDLGLTTIVDEIGNVIIKSVSFEELRGGAEGSLAPGTCVIMQL